jgi:hypothetical protein
VGGFCKKICIQRGNGLKFVLSPKEELGHERIVTKLKEVWGGLLKGGDNHCKKGN